MNWPRQTLWQLFLATLLLNDFKEIPCLGVNSISRGCQSVLSRREAGILKKGKKINV